MTISDELESQLAKIRAKPYNLDDPTEVQRLYRECRGYLQLCHHKHGTDWEGRKFAIDALDALTAKTDLVRRLAAAQRS